MESFKEDKTVIGQIFIIPLQKNPNNTILLNEFEGYFKDAMRTYVKHYKLKKFYEYLN